MQVETLNVDGSRVRHVGPAEAIPLNDHEIDLYRATVELAAVYRLPLWPLHHELRRLYAPASRMPTHDLVDLRRQIEEHIFSRPGLEGTEQDHEAEHDR